LRAWAAVRVRAHKLLVMGNGLTAGPRLWVAPHACAAPQGERRGHLIVFRFDLDARGEELVNGVEVAEVCREVERGPAILRWRSGGAAVLERRGDDGSGAHELGEAACGQDAFICMPTDDI
jgi:hypothetical protein